MFGVPIIVSDVAFEETDQRLFPASRHRSARIRKKLIKRFGGEFRKVPCIWRTPQGLVAHPVIYARLKAEIAARPIANQNPWLSPSPNPNGDKE